MRASIAPLLVTTIAGSSAGQAPPPDVQLVLGRALAHAESVSLYRDRVDWPATRATALRLADTARSVPALAPALRHLLRSLGDEDGRVYHGGRLITYYSGDPNPHHASITVDLYNRSQAASAFPFRAEIVAPAVGSVRIVGLPMGDNLAMARTIESAVCRVHAQGARRWIVDLRFNGGGLLNPMAEGVAAIVGERPRRFA